MIERDQESSRLRASSSLGVKASALGPLPIRTKGQIVNPILSMYMLQCVRYKDVRGKKDDL